MPLLRLLALAAALLAFPAAARDIPNIRLAPGESVTVRFDDGGRVGEPSRERAKWTRYDVLAARELAGMTPPQDAMPEGIPLRELDGVKPEPIPADEVRVRFMSIGDKHALLVVENGQGRGLRYRARMTAGGVTKPTDVCIVLPRRPSYEHWPYRIERIELSDFEFIPWNADRLPTCD
ncbi:MAG: hypothetical protein ABWX67_05585 [Allosphingosinicella sp.]